MPKGQELDVLSRRQCLDLLNKVRVGRLVFTEEALPAVQPVNFRLWHDDVVFRVAGGAKLSAATEKQVVAFEADELDAEALRNSAAREIFTNPAKNLAERMSGRQVVLAGEGAAMLAMFQVI